MNPSILLLAALSLSGPSTAQTSRGSCEYASSDPARKGVTYCTYAASEQQCTTTATSKTSAEYVRAHPPRFSPGGDCTKSGKAFQKKARKKGAGSARDAGRSSAAP